MSLGPEKMVTYLDQLDIVRSGEDWIQKRTGDGWLEVNRIYSGRGE